MSAEILSLHIRCRQVPFNRLLMLCDFLPRIIQATFGGTVPGRLHIMNVSVEMIDIMDGSLEMIKPPKNHYFTGLPRTEENITVAAFGKEGLVISPYAIDLVALGFVMNPTIVVEWHLFPRGKFSEETLCSIVHQVRAEKLEGTLRKCGLTLWNKNLVWVLPKSPRES